MINNQLLLDEAFGNVDIEGRILCLHCSFSKVKNLFNDPDNLINFFMEKDCTLVVPVHNYALRVWYNPVINIIQNGLDMEERTPQSSHIIYTKKARSISSELGVVSKYVFLRKESVIGNHPENSFAASGPKAEEIIHTQSPWNVYSPYDQIMMDDKALILLFGVDLSKATPVHYAELLSGRKPFIRWYRDENGIIRPMRVGGCSNGFNACYPFISHLDLCKNRDNESIKIYPFREFIYELVNIIRHNPQITRCSDPECTRCRDILKGGPCYSFKELKL